ncbi:MAG: hypothetical protein A2487_05615 [Candidatus Raymondbacteria bacterium RifOxyC12_full_50_8]|nr:MAG: hypothetical protein A2487_05615 [Candidatus Raymondbacteria bacterium RifOxyC12_full_50_8]
MRQIDFQDSVYRTQPTEKIQARQNQQPVEGVYLNQMKKGVEDETKQNTVVETEDMRGKITEREKREQERRERQRRRREREAASRDDHAAGDHLIDIEA